MMLNLARVSKQLEVKMYATTITQNIILLAIHIVKREDHLLNMCVSLYSKLLADLLVIEIHS